MAEEFTLRTKKEFDQLMESVDAEMRADGISIPARPLDGWRRICFRFGLKLTLPAPDRLPAEGRYEGHDLTLHILKWFNERYGDKLAIDPSSRIVILIKGDAYSIKLPLIFGTANIFCDPAKMGITKSGVISRGPTIINALDCVEGLTAIFASSLDRSELEHITHTLVLGLGAINELRSLPQVQMVDEIQGDLNASVSHLLTRPPENGLSKWASLQIVEKLIKVFIAQSGQSFKTTHKLSDLNRTQQDWDTQAASSKSPCCCNLNSSASTSGS